MSISLATAAPAELYVGKPTVDWTGLGYALFSAYGNQLTSEGIAAQTFFDTTEIELVQASDLWAGGAPNTDLKRQVDAVGSTFSTSTGTCSLLGWEDY